MISANLEVIADRKLFHTLYAHQPSCSLASNDHDCQNTIEKFAGSIMHMLLRVQTALQHKIDQLNRRLEDMSIYCRRLETVKNNKKSDRYFTFANSPMSKSWSSPPQSAQKSNPHNRQQSTTPKSRSPQYLPQSLKTQPRLPLPLPQISPSPAWQVPEYFSQKLNQLRSQVSQLRQHIDIGYPIVKQDTETIRKQSKPYSILQSIELNQGGCLANGHGVVRRLSSFRQYWGEAADGQGLGKGEGDRDGDRDGEGDFLGVKSELEKCRAIIKQYKRQQQLMKQKNQKYKQLLEQILNWLQNLRETELPNYLPCQHCTLIKSIFDYLQQKPATSTTPRKSPSPPLKLSPSPPTLPLPLPLTPTLPPPLPPPLTPPPPPTPTPAQMMRQQQHSQNDSLLMQDEQNYGSPYILSSRIAYAGGNWSGAGGDQIGGDWGEEGEFVEVGDQRGQDLWTLEGGQDGDEN